jgi:lipoprotein-releasing system ATP-binding protein
MTDLWLIEARGLTKSYRREVAGGDEFVPVLANASLALRAGESVAVQGDSGSGKSTLLNLLGGLDRPDSGTVVHLGAALPEGIQARARWRRLQVGFIFQFHGLLSELSAEENIALAGLVAGDRLAGALVKSRGLLQQLGLTARATHHPSELSGGEQQRVAIGRALYGSPSLVLADEPTGNLDPSTGDRVLDLLFDLQAARGFALVVATHSSRLAKRCDRVVRLAGGSLVDDTGDRDRPTPPDGADPAAMTVRP